MVRRVGLSGRRTFQCLERVIRISWTPSSVFSLRCTSPRGASARWLVTSSRVIWSFLTAQACASSSRRVADALRASRTRRFSSYDYSYLTIADVIGCNTACWWVRNMRGCAPINARDVRARPGQQLGRRVAAPAALPSPVSRPPSYFLSYVPTAFTLFSYICGTYHHASPYRRGVGQISSSELASYSTPPFIT